MNRTEFVEMLKALSTDEGYPIDKIPQDERFDLKMHFADTAELIVKYDEQYKREQEAVPTIDRFIRDIPASEEPSFVFRLWNTHVFRFSRREYASFYHGCHLSDNYVVVSYKRKVTKNGNLGNGIDNYSLEETLYDAVIEPRKAHSNVKD